MITIRAIRLRSLTSTNTFGADLNLKNGLNIIQADNSSGKSTCVQSIVYCLGMERSLGPKLDVPLPLAMKERIAHKKHGGVEDYEYVLQSYAMLEIENSSGSVVTIRRDIAGGKEKKLVQVWYGGKLTDGSKAFEQRDFFLSDAGSATREKGFHTFLADFIGWELPAVPKYDGSECPLYLETLFPMFFVEQKSGWSTIQGPFPTFIGIQDMSRRVMEFILNLDAGKVRRDRSEIKKRIKSLEAEWSLHRKLLISEAGSLMRFEGLPIKPNTEFSKSVELNTFLYHEDDWQPFETAKELVKNDINILDRVELVNVGEAAKLLQDQLIETQEKLDTTSVKINFLRNEFHLNTTEHNSVIQQISLLELDLKRNLDAKKLQSLGSALGSSASDSSCPTCHQGVSRELLPETTKKGMAIDENIAFVRSQLDLYKSIKEITEKTLNDTRIKYRSLNEDIRVQRSQIRNIKNDLTRSETSKHRSTIQNIVQKQSKLERWHVLQEGLDSRVDELQTISKKWAIETSRMKKLGSGQLSPSDKLKISKYQRNIQNLLKLFSFSSFKPDEINLSDDNFRPQVFTTNKKGEAVEKDIGFEASASDGIRLKWAYYLGLLELSESHDVNNIGFSIFDEPGQQEMKDIDLMSFLGWAASNTPTNRQIIVTTSEELPKVKAGVARGEAHILQFDNYILQTL